MNCREFAAISRDYARQEWMNDTLRAEAAEHLKICAACGQHLAWESALEAGFAALRREAANAAPGPATAAAVMAAFEREHGNRSVSRKFWIAAAMAAALSIAFWLGRSQSELERAPEIAKRSQVPAETPSTPVVEEPAPAVMAVPRPAVLRVRPRSSPQVAQASPRERLTGFVPIRYGKPIEPGEELRIMRIQLPPSELLRLGIPVSPDASGALVRADVLLGEDGLAKAIRFVY